MEDSTVEEGVGVPCSKLLYLNSYGDSGIVEFPD